MEIRPVLPAVQRDAVPGDALHVRHPGIVIEGRATRHAEPPEPLKLQIHIKAKNWHQKLAPNAIKSPWTLRHDHFRVNA